MRKSAQRYREISDDVMRWLGVGRVGRVLVDAPACIQLRRRASVRFLWFATALGGITSHAFAQAPDRFEVASIKPGPASAQRPAANRLLRAARKITTFPA